MSNKITNASTADDAWDAVQMERNHSELSNEANRDPNAGEAGKEHCAPVSAERAAEAADLVVGQPPRVKLIPLKSTWTCPDCERQNVYKEGIVSDPQDKCWGCGAQVTIGAIRATCTSDTGEGAASPWLPIETAPKDGTFILLLGDSGYINTPDRVAVGRWVEGYRDFWLTHSNDAFTDDGEPATHWMPLPESPFSATQDTKSVASAALPNDAVAGGGPSLPESLLQKIATAYPDDPGTSDLYDEQPVTLSITLGDVRAAQLLIHQLEG